MPGENLKAVDWTQSNMQPVVKQLYRKHEDVARRSDAEIDEWIAENEVTLENKNIPRPIFQFTEASYPGASLNYV